MCTVQVALLNKNGTDTCTLCNIFPQHKLFTSYTQHYYYGKDSGIPYFLSCDFTVLSVKNLL